MYISIVIITLNEEKAIGKCIDSVMNLADEIIVVDSYSSDNTALIAKAKGATFVEHRFEGYTKQKNWAITQAKFDWILSLDADETLSPELQNSILAIKKNGPVYKAYSINRLNFYCGRAIKTCNWYPDKKIRLWQKGFAEWIGKDVHEKPEVKPGVNIGHLDGDLLHNTYPTHQDMLKQVENFANIAARDLAAKSYSLLIFKAIFSAPFKFIRNYIIKLGFIDGLAGFLICFHQSREVYLKYTRAIKLKLKLI
jgi:glycosyltransferase involved in cell wall biosynthesis